MEALLLWFAIFSFVGWLAAELLEPNSSSALAPPIPEGRPPRRVRRTMAHSRSRSPLPAPSPSPILLSPLAAPFAASHAVVMVNHPINMDRSSFLNEDDEAHFGRMQRVFDPVVGWRWRVYPAGMHEARMQQLRENREGKTPVEVEPDTQSPDKVLPPPRPSSTGVVTTLVTTLRHTPPASRPSLPASLLLPGIPTLSELAGVQLLAAVPSPAPGFIEQFAALCEATRFAPIRWPTPSFAEQFARKCRATQHLPLRLPLPSNSPAPPPAPVTAPLPAPLLAPVAVPPLAPVAAALAGIPPALPLRPAPASNVAEPPPVPAAASAPPTAPPQRVVLAARSRRTALQLSASAPAPASTSAQASSLAPIFAPASAPASAPAQAPSIPARAPRPPRPSRPAAAPKRVAAPGKSVFASLLDEAKKG
ncbi:hypothetical protein HBI64_015510 [Parastagonospora nodorum]|nr:hypothetical protein HBI64_015510 [Parastagonospora nodorum]